MHRPSLVAAMLAASLCVAPRSMAGDWPEFRGAGAMGHSDAKNVPVRWSATENVAWKTAIPGEGWSSPVLLGGRLYLTSALPREGGGLSLAVFCIDAASGKVRWQTNVLETGTAGPAIHSKNGHASPTPIATPGGVYVHFGHHGTAALGLDGRVLWRETSVSYQPVHGNGGSPVLVDGLLVFSADGAERPRVVALDAKDGSVRWQTPRETPAKRKFSFSTPLVIGEPGHRQIISPGSGAVCAYDPADGRELWRVLHGEGYSVIPRPVLAHGLLFVGTGYDRPLIHAIRTGGAGDVTATHLAWTLAKGAPNTPSMVVVDDLLYCVSDAGIASAIEAKTGQVAWTERLGGNFSASILHADGRLYLQNEEGMGFVLKPGRSFEVLARNDLGERSLASHAVEDGALYIRTKSSLYRIGQPPALRGE